MDVYVHTAFLWPILAAKLLCKASGILASSSDSQILQQDPLALGSVLYPGQPDCSLLSASSVPLFVHIIVDLHKILCTCFSTLVHFNSLVGLRDDYGESHPSSNIPRAGIHKNNVVNCRSTYRFNFFASQLKSHLFPWIHCDIQEKGLVFGRFLKKS
jgi:hypothetical protein